MLEDSSSLTRKTLKSTYITAVTSISLVLFLLGIMGILLLQASRAADYVKENFQVTILLKPEAQQTEINDLLQTIQRNVAVKAATYVSKEEAATKLKAELGEDFVTFLGYNPLNPTIDVRFKAAFADEKNINLFKQYLANKAVILEFNYEQSLVEKINENLKSITMMMLGFSAILIFVAIILINNTIRISLYAKRMLIKSMQLVGATKAFIRAPFLIRAILNGFYATLISFGLVYGTFYFVRQQFAEILIVNDQLIWLELFGGLLTIGVFISLVSTFFSVNKWLSKSTSELH